eukprot:CAMPEP_0176006116 /NCGR_PEP_ID=MMETSP0120_2-20121206/2555_1 /TAXON_ID=160619 /ORGANISM="Kryptoperidinium foliaceum, Strain CCMP 1326" /LENGTH=305 /DNA_ID=CAMNT_0017338843 /DNA_START=87 /DNA_END=1004 /DNA_ORIENTATION=+
MAPAISDHNLRCVLRRIRSHATCTATWNISGSTIPSTLVTCVVQLHRGAMQNRAFASHATLCIGALHRPRDGDPPCAMGQELRERAKPVNKRMQPPPPPPKVGAAAAGAVDSAVREGAGEAAPTCGVVNSAVQSATRQPGGNSMDNESSTAADTPPRPNSKPFGAGAARDARTPATVTVGSPALRTKASAPTTKATTRSRDELLDAFVGLGPAKEQAPQYSQLKPWATVAGRAGGIATGCRNGADRIAAAAGGAGEDRAAQDTARTTAAASAPPSAPARTNARRGTRCRRIANETLAAPAAAAGA